MVRCGCKKIIRVGSAGALQSSIRLGELIVVEGAVRHDGASTSHIETSYPAIADIALTVQINNILIKQGAKFYSGLVRSYDSFYTEAENEICAYWSIRGILGADVETGALY